MHNGLRVLTHRIFRETENRTQEKQDKRLKKWVTVVIEVLSASQGAMIFLIFYATEGFLGREQWDQYFILINIKRLYIY